MVLLTMTPAIVRALAKAGELSSKELAKLQLPAEPSLAEPKPGNPISHSQLIDLSKLLKKHASSINAQEKDKEESTKDAEQDTVVYTLDALLCNSKIYVPPPPPKKEPTPEYIALMARLRAEQEQLAYMRMVHNSSTSTTQPQFSIGSSAPPDDDDDVSYEEVHRQMILIINVLISIVACAVFIWVAARHWSIAKRIGLSMGGSGAVAVAEVAVYSGYVRRVKEAKRREKKRPEIKEIVQSWVIDRSAQKDADVISGARAKSEDGVRYRKGKHR